MAWAVVYDPGSQSKNWSLGAIERMTNFARCTGRVPIRLMCMVARRFRVDGMQLSDAQEISRCEEKVPFLTLGWEVREQISPARKEKAQRVRRW